MDVVRTGFEFFVKRLTGAFVQPLLGCTVVNCAATVSALPRQRVQCVIASPSVLFDNGGIDVVDRIEQTTVCQVINLSATEKTLYDGAGWKLARFVNAQLVGFFDPRDIQWQDDAQAMADEAFEAATAWLANASGEVWLVLCSHDQLSEPRRILMTDAAAIAHMARVFGEQIGDEY